MSNTIASRLLRDCLAMALTRMPQLPTSADKVWGNCATPAFVIASAVLDGYFAILRSSGAATLQQELLPSAFCLRLRGRGRGTEAYKRAGRH